MSALGTASDALGTRVGLMLLYVQRLECVTPPDLYDVLGDLKLALWPDLLRALAAALDRADEFCGLRNDDGTDAAEDVATARLLLRDAATAAEAVRESLEVAQCAIARTSAQPR